MRTDRRRELALELARTTPMGLPEAIALVDRLHANHGRYFEWVAAQVPLVPWQPRCLDWLLPTDPQPRTAIAPDICQRAARLVTIRSAATHLTQEAR